jgi:NTP pyrophosphatase (non-canonical NTP hydrolase)
MKMRTKMIGKMKMMMRRMTGKMGHSSVASFEDAFDKQIDFQKEIIKKYQSHIMDHRDLPIDNPELFQYHMTAMVEELGEVLKADKRWKTHRNDAYDPENKLEEIADVFITAINVCIFSGYDSSKIMDKVNSKILDNYGRMIEKDK